MCPFCTNSFTINTRLNLNLIFCFSFRLVKCLISVSRNILVCEMLASTFIFQVPSNNCLFTIFSNIISVLLPVLRTILCSSHWLLSHITIVETKDSYENHQSSERILTEPVIEPLTSCSQVHYATY